jgi:hypothetical protein
VDLAALVRFSGPGSAASIMRNRQRRSCSTWTAVPRVETAGITVNATAIRKKEVGQLRDRRNPARPRRAERGPLIPPRFAARPRIWIVITHPVRAVKKCAKTASYSLTDVIARNEKGAEALWRRFGADRRPPVDEPAQAETALHSAALRPYTIASGRISAQSRFLHRCSGRSLNPEPAWVLFGSRR